MACQTCDHTVHKVGVMCEPYNDVPLFWCPRCGTLKANVVIQEGEAPSLIGKVIEFAGKLTEEHEDLIVEFESLGIRESTTIDS